jgi:hypothetical protein
LKFSFVENNNITGEQELTTVVHALQTYRFNSEGTNIVVVTGHNPLVEGKALNGERKP